VKKRRSYRVVVLLIVCFVSSLLLAQQTRTAATVETTGPSLSETLDWVKGALASYGRVTVSRGENNWTAIDTYQYSLSGYDSCQLLFDFSFEHRFDNSDQRHDHKKSKATVTLSLRDMDPSFVKLTENVATSISSAGGYSVTLRTSSLATAITWKQFQAEDLIRGGLVGEEKITQKNFLDLYISDKDMGDRLVKALSHAVVLCGGKQSAF
jgi:hypothetical protein